MGISNTPPITWIKIIQSIVFVEYLHEGIAFLLGFVRVMQYPSKTFEICYGAQRTYNYYNRGIACAFNNYGHKPYPSNSLDRNNLVNGVYMLPS